MVGSNTAFAGVILTVFLAAARVPISVSNTAVVAELDSGWGRVTNHLGFEGGHATGLWGMGSMEGRGQVVEHYHLCVPTYHEQPRTVRPR